MSLARLGDLARRGAQPARLGAALQPAFDPFAALDAAMALPAEATPAERRAALPIAALPASAQAHLPSPAQPAAPAPKRRARPPTPRDAGAAAETPAE